MHSDASRRAGGDLTSLI